ncbi:MAG: N-acetylglucosamine-specific PTS transporter subunit IIBC [Synergistaceae bacterium]|jgi:PTS system N-acetylglucosamine-specific IIC component|nr:N-acetylglucosamine-specific PTS transporter subunit IIBC [Synergistaceae bacterium]
MMKILQKLGKSLMLPVAALPVAAILMGVGYWIDPSGWGTNNAVSAFLIKAGGAIIDNMPILFAIGVAVGMADDNDGTSALAGLISWLMIQTLLSPGAVAMFSKIDASEVNPAFGKINNQFIGILSGLIGSTCYNGFKNTKLPDALAFFSGKRCVAIVTAAHTIVAVIVLYFLWPAIYTTLVTFGRMVISTGAFGAGIYAFLNRLLIPLGLHHALNSVFWFDIAGINDIAKFWGAAPGGVRGETGMYMTGFFPVMMFGLPAAAAAMYRSAKPGKKRIAGGLLLSGALAAVFTGITEPLEFSFMFLAPLLYFVHSVLTGIFAAVCAILPVRSGFNFSAGFVDWFLSFKSPMALNPLYVIPIGAVAAAVYYPLFRFMIVRYNLKTPGRDDDDISDAKERVTLGPSDFASAAETIIEGLGGAGNIAILDNCVTRLRVEVKNYERVSERKIKSAGASGVMRPSKTAVQVIIGTNVQFVADEIKKKMKVRNDENV